MSNLTEPHRRGLIGAQPVSGSAGTDPEVVKSFSVGWLVAPAALWMTVFLIVPFASIVVFSFLGIDPDTRTPYFTLFYYGEFFYNEGFFDEESRRYLTLSIFVRTLGTTIYYTLFVMVLCLLAAYPIAFFLAMQVKSFKFQMALFLLAMVPFWTSYLIRAVAWLPMLGRRGLINTALQSMGIIDKPIEVFLYSEFGYVMALVQLYVVLSVGPIFFSLAKLDRGLIEAARDMGASPFQIFREIIGPLSLPGVAIGMIFIFVLIMGEFATAVVVYGGKPSTAGSVLLNYYATANYSFSAVNAIMLMLAMMVGVIIILRIVDIRKEL